MFSCEVCGKEVKTKLALAGHKRTHNKNENKEGIEIAASSPRPPLTQPGPGEETLSVNPDGSPAFVTFRSPMSSGLRIVIKPSMWTTLETPAGTVKQVVPGKTVEFLNGIFKTNDPDVIDFLENRYKSDRYPIFSDSNLRKMGVKV